jgi:hypothetical protein
VHEENTTGEGFPPLVASVCQWSGGGGSSSTYHHQKQASELVFMGSGWWGTCLIVSNTKKWMRNIAGIPCMPTPCVPFLPAFAFEVAVWRWWSARLLWEERNLPSHCVCLYHCICICCWQTWGSEMVGDNGKIAGIPGGVSPLLVMSICEADTTRGEKPPLSSRPLCHCICICCWQTWESEW